MTQVSIKGGEYPIFKIFSDEFFFIIPYYQRPYSWTTEHAGKLLDDFLEFIENEGDKNIEEMNPYFLGSIVLIKGDGPTAEVLDGQQRLITLTILLSALRTQLPNLESELTDYLYEVGKQLRGTPNRYRITLREQDAHFFQEYIQDNGGINKLLDSSDSIDITYKSQINIIENASLFVDRLEKLPKLQLDQLAKFITNRCFLVVVTTPDFDSAYRIFSILNDRGLNLSFTDILKADLIGKINPEHQEEYAEKWIRVEEKFGSDDFRDLFAHIRMIFRKMKSKGSMLNEFRDLIIPDMNPQEFIDDILLNYAAAFYLIKSETYKSDRNAEEVNSLFRWLNLINNFDWMPPAILYLSKYWRNTEKILTFFKDLERLAAGLMIKRAADNERIERYGRLLSAIEKGDDLYMSESPLQLTAYEKYKILDVLNGDIYPIRYLPRYLLLRLDSKISDGLAFYKNKVITVEHVLPQNVSQGSIWEKWFPTKELQDNYVHLLGNLVLLSRNKNSKASNYDFEYKKKNYFTTEGGASSFALTSKVLEEQIWTPEIIKHRQMELIGILTDIWRLELSEIEQKLLASQKLGTEYQKGYRGKTITSFELNGTKYNVNYWNEMLVQICSQMAASHNDKFAKVLTLTGQMRPYFTRNPDELRSAKKINGTDIYVETNLGSDMIVKISRKVINLFDYNDENLQIITN